MRDALIREARRARSLGFGGKLVIHPKQIGPARAGFRPEETELARARGVLKAAARAGEGVFSYEGRMVGAPVIAKARQLLVFAG